MSVMLVVCERKHVRVHECVLCVLESRINITGTKRTIRHSLATVIRLPTAIYKQGLKIICTRATWSLYVQCKPHSECNNNKIRTLRLKLL